MIIYRITNLVTGKSYIGQTKQTLSKRIINHKARLKSGDFKNSPIYTAFIKYGWNNFIWEILCYCRTKQDLDLEEKRFIKELNTKYPNGYNLTDGGDGGTTGYNHTTIDKQKMSKLKEGKYLGENNPFYGKTFSKEVKFRMAEAHSKEYWIIFPDGKIELIKNMTSFCKEYNLDRSAMCKVLSGKYKHYKNFVCKYK